MLRAATTSRRRVLRIVPRGFSGLSSGRPRTSGMAMSVELEAAQAERDQGEHRQARAHEPTPAGQGSRFHSRLPAPGPDFLPPAFE